MSKKLIIIIVISILVLTIIFFSFKKIIKEKLVDIDISFDKINSIGDKNLSINLKLKVINKSNYNFTVKRLKFYVYYQSKLVATADFGDIKSKHKSTEILTKSISVLLNEQSVNLAINEVLKKKTDINYKASANVFYLPIVINGKI
jgi:hypothetical protein